MPYNVSIITELQYTGGKCIELEIRDTAQTFYVDISFMEIDAESFDRTLTKVSSVSHGEILEHIRNTFGDIPSVTFLNPSRIERPHQERLRDFLMGMIGKDILESKGIYMPIFVCNGPLHQRSSKCLVLIL